MKTTIVIDDDLMEQAKNLGGLNTKKAVVEVASIVFIQIQLQLKIHQFKGKLK